MDKLEHCLGSDFQYNLTALPLERIVYHHLQSEMVEVPRETPGDVVDWQVRDLGADSGALYQGGDEQLQAGGLVQAYHGLGSPIDPQYVVASCGRRDLPGGRGSVRLVQVTETVIVVRLTLRLSGHKQLELVSHHLPAGDDQAALVPDNPGGLHLSLQLQAVLEEFSREVREADELVQCDSWCE